jgi:predicted SPOUT superfamily RNA methylase MTH1
MRKNLFPSHPDLKFASVMPELGIPPHMKKTEEMKYREGVVQREKFVYCGLDKVSWNV